MIPADAFQPLTGSLDLPRHFQRAGSARALPRGRVFAPPAQPLISATVLVKNSRRTLAAALAALSWCDEVIVVDTGSTDDSIAIAKGFANVRLHRLTGEFPGFGVAHQRAVRLARNNWILSVDSDEIVSAELAAEIEGLPLSDEAVYSAPFRNHFNGRHITTCGWSPDRHERLFNRVATNFCASEVHERVQTAGLTVVSLRAPIDHYSYGSHEDFLRKMANYARLFARQNAGRRRSGAVTAVTRGAWAFFKSYVLERGMLQGGEGLVISAYKSQTVFWKYLLLHEANRQAAA